MKSPHLLTIIWCLSCHWLLAAGDCQRRPNIVWIVSEDNSVHYLQHFFPGGAKAPHIEALAAHGLTFDHAYSNAPVCSVARTTLITGCYAPRIGTQFHRKYRAVPMPPQVRMFPAYLRAAGYYTTNNAKKDYNAIEGPGVWDESSRRATWRNRPDPQQPFFHFESHAQSHESSLHFPLDVFRNEKTVHDPAQVKLADYHPDTPLFRYTHARYLDRMQVIDSIVGETVKKLEEDGLLEDTFIFYFGDHGGVLPRSKGYVYDSGLHVPLVVRIPKNFRHLVDATMGTRVEGFVSFIDFGPTVLKLAGVEIPQGIDGRPFLGPSIPMAEVNRRRESFGYADRFDEKYDLVRSLHFGKYHYVRCFQPYLPDGLNNNYRYKMLAYQEWRQLWKQGRLKHPQVDFFARKPVEMLFDVEADPHEVRNLAGNPELQGVLQDLRRRLRAKLDQLPDLSAYPESYLARAAFNQPVAFGASHAQEIQELWDTADLALMPYERAAPLLRKALQSDNPWKRYWGLMVCTTFGEQAKPLVTLARPLLQDARPIVRVRAAEFLGSLGVINPQSVLIDVVNSTDDAILATEALNSVVWFRDFFDGRYPVRRADFHPRATGADVMDRLNYINGTPYPQRATRKKRSSKKKQRAGDR